MAKFFEQVKTLINDVDSLLGQLKDKQLSGTAKTLKTSIQKQIQDLREDKPQLAASVSIEPAYRTRDVPEIPQDDDLYEDPNDEKFNISSKTSEEELLKKDLPASDRDTITQEGFLKHRKEKKTGIFGKSKSKSWCVIRGKIFYIYEKKNSKKQTECFIVDGYQATPMEKEGSKKDVTFPFEIVSENRKTYVFDALTADDQTTWVRTLQHVTGIGPRKRPVTGPPPDIPEVDTVEEDLYEDTERIIPARTVPPSSSSSLPPTPKRSPAGNSGRPLAADTVSQSASSGQSSNTPSGESMADEIYDETTVAAEEADPDELYDETMGVPEEETTPRSPVNKSSLFSASLQRQSQRLESARRTPPPPAKALPPTPATPSTPPRTHAPPATPPRTPPKTSPSPAAEPSYADMYYGVWDCTSDNTKELSFSRGDVITVLSKQYEDRGWWVARLHERVGLVPKTYLTEAYERA